MSPKIHQSHWQGRPGFYIDGERIDYRLGERFGNAVARHKAAKAKGAKPAAMAAPKQPTPDRRAAQDRNAAELKALAADTAELRQAVERHTPAAPMAEKPAAKERTGFAGRCQVARNGFSVFGSKHEQRAE